MRPAEYFSQPDHFSKNRLPRPFDKADWIFLICNEGSEQLQLL